MSSTKRRWHREFTLHVAGGFSPGDLWIGLFVHKGIVEIGVPFFRLTVSW